MRILDVIDRPITDRQREVLDVISGYNDAIGEGCPLRVVARRLGLHHSTIHQHVGLLRRKGFLRTSGSPAFVLRRP